MKKHWNEKKSLQEHPYLHYVLDQNEDDGAKAPVEEENIKLSYMIMKICFLRCTVNLHSKGPTKKGNPPLKDIFVRDS